MDSSESKPNTHSVINTITRRGFLVGAAALTASIAGNVLKNGTGSFAQTNELPETDVKTDAKFSINNDIRTELGSDTGVTVYDDLTPGIGVGVAWVGRNSPWNPIVENIINATASVNVTPYIFVPKHLENDFKTFAAENSIPDGKYRMMLNDPEYVESDDAAEIGTGKNKTTVKKGFRSSWIRDWGTIVVARGADKMQLNVRKEGMADPLKGTKISIPLIEVALRFDGGGYFPPIKSPDGKQLFIASEDEFINYNSYFIKKEMGDVDIKEEVVKRIKKIYGDDINVVFLPRLLDNGVDHVDLMVMPMIDDYNIVVGNAKDDDKNHEILNNVAHTFSNKGFKVSRVPVRRLGNSTLSWVNILPHRTLKGEKIVFMPVYQGFENENNEAEQIYASMGYKVVRVDATSVMDKGGAVHCATNTSMTAALMETV